MWTNDNRTRYTRKSDRYPSDLTDKEWQIVEAHLPVVGRTDRRREMLVNRRANLTRDRRPILTRGGVPVHRADRRHFNALPLAALLT